MTTELEGEVFIQYKGTDICVDIRCPCGALGHYDGDFLYAVECAHCHRKFDMPQTPKLLPFSGRWDPKMAQRDEDFVEDEA